MKTSLGYGVAGNLLLQAGEPSERWLTALKWCWDNLPENPGLLDGFVGTAWLTEVMVNRSHSIFFDEHLSVIDKVIGRMIDQAPSRFALDQHSGIPGWGTYLLQRARRKDDSTRELLLSAFDRVSEELLIAEADGFRSCLRWGVAHGIAGALVFHTKAAHHLDLVAEYSLTRRISTLLLDAAKTGGVNDYVPNPHSWCNGWVGICGALACCAIVTSDPAGLDECAAVCERESNWALQNVADNTICHGHAGIRYVKATIGYAQKHFGISCVSKLSAESDSVPTGDGLLTGSAGVRMAQAADHFSAWNELLCLPSAPMMSD